VSKAKTRIYVVGGSGGLSLIRAYSSVQARSFVAEQAFSVEVASQDMLVELLSGGHKVVDAAKPETADAFEPQCKTPCPEERLAPMVEAADESVLGPDFRSTHVTEVA
jgi:hypothetical protein